MMFQLTVRDDLTEVINYTSSNVPIRAVQGKLSHFPNKAAVCHWHNDLECIIVVEGTMNYFVNGQVYQLTQGMGIIVNTKRLHFGYGVNESDCVFLVLLLHTSLLGSDPYIESHYLNPLLYDTNSDAILLSEDVTWHREALLLITTLFQLGQEQPAHYEFQIPIQFASLWLLLYENTIAKNGSHQSPSASSNHLKEMIGYIQKHYPEKISLDDIASAGFMCRSKCCQLFKQILHQSPIEYLLHYRIEKSLSLLANNNLTITDIATACGFNGASYYTEVFRKIIGISPSTYRKSKLSF